MEIGHLLTSAGLLLTVIGGPCVYAVKAPLACMFTVDPMRRVMRWVAFGLSCALGGALWLASRSVDYYDTFGIGRVGGQVTPEAWELWLRCQKNIARLHRLPEMDLLVWATASALFLLALAELAHFVAKMSHKAQRQSALNDCDPGPETG